MKKDFVILLLLSINYLAFSQCDTTIMSEPDGNWESKQLTNGVFIAQSESDYKKFYGYSSNIDFSNKMLISFYACCVCKSAKSELEITCRPDSVIFSYTAISKNNQHQMPCGYSSNEFIIDKIDLSSAYFRLKSIYPKESRKWSAK